MLSDSVITQGYSEISVLRGQKQGFGVSATGSLAQRSESHQLSCSDDVESLRQFLYPRQGSPVDDTQRARMWKRSHCCESIQLAV